MKRFLFIIFSLLFVSPLFAANNFSSDPHCVGVFRFEDGALEREEINNDNSFLTNSGVVSEGTEYKEGSYSAAFDTAASDSLYVADGDLPSGWPLKNGDSNGLISVTCWFYRDLNGAGYYTWGKWDNGNGKRSLALGSYTTGGKIYLLMGYNSGSSTESATGATGLFSAMSISSNTWYHIGITCNMTTGAWTARIYEDGGSSTSDSGTFSNAPGNIEDANFSIGSISTSGSPSASFDGFIDELAVFDDILTDQQIDDIKDGVYDLSSGTGTSITLTGVGQ